MYNTITPSHAVFLTALLDSISGVCLLSVLGYGDYLLTLLALSIQYVLIPYGTNLVIIIYVYVYLVVVTMCIMHTWIAIGWTYNH